MNATAAELAECACWMQVVWMRRGGALGGLPHGTSLSAPHKSSLIPVARLDSGSQRTRHRTHSYTGQAPQLPLDHTSASQMVPMERATVDGSIAMDRANGNHWRPVSRGSFTGESSSAAAAYSSQSQQPSWNLQQIERGWASSRSPVSSPRQRGQPHRLKAMSTDGSLSQLQAQPSAPQWSPDITYQEDTEGPSHAHRSDHAPCLADH